MSTKLSLENLDELAGHYGVSPTNLVIAAISDDIITGDGYVGHGSDTRRVYHLAGSVADFETYVKRLALRLQD